MSSIPGYNRGAERFILGMERFCRLFWTRQQRVRGGQIDGVRIDRQTTSRAYWCAGALIGATLQSGSLFQETELLGPQNGLRAILSIELAADAVDVGFDRTDG